MSSVITSRASLLFLLPCIFLFLGASCTQDQQGSATLAGSIFRSTDAGKTWVSKSLITDAHGKKTLLSQIDVSSFLINPKHTQTLFMGTKQHGLFVSDSSGDNWKQLIPNQYIIDISLDQSNSCTLFAATPQRIFKTQDCGKNWEGVFRESRDGVFITSIALDHATPDIMYAVNSIGELLKSIDHGRTWELQYQFQNTSLVKIFPDAYDSNTVFLATKDGAIYKTTNRGVSWKLISEGLKRYDSSKSFRSIQSLHGRNGLLFISQNAIFRTYDGGNVWDQVRLLTTQNSARITTGAANPLNDSEILYATKDTLYQTSDGGEHWLTRSLPSKRPPSLFIFDPDNPTNLYVGVQAPGENASPYWQ